MQCVPQIGMYLLFSRHKVHGQILAIRIVDSSKSALHLEVSCGKVPALWSFALTSSIRLTERIQYLTHHNFRE